VSYRLFAGREEKGLAEMYMGDVLIYGIEADTKYAEKESL
jgi:hypothetical protein